MAGNRTAGGSIVAAAAIFGLMLVGVGIANWRAVEAASYALVRGQADLLHDQLRVSLGREQPTSPELDELRQSYADQQLDYLALVDRTGMLVAESGQSAWPQGSAEQSTTGITIDRHGDRVRARYRRGLPARLARRLGVPATLLVFEFEPRSVNQLERRARWGVGVSVLFGLFAVGLALSYTRERGRTESALRAEEQSRRLAALGQMSAVLAHELRNPLASLKGHAQLLERTLDGAQRDKAQLVVSEAVRLERLSNDLLTFVRTGELHRAPTDVVALVRDVVAGREQVSLSAPRSVTLELDAERMRQVVSNLVDNAVAAGLPVEISVTSDAIAIRDHGPGITEPARLFEPFYTTKTNGTGLGLAIARQITELHGGTLDAVNADRGATFTIRLPREAA